VRRWLIGSATAALALIAAKGGAGASGPPVPIPAGQAHYLESCGGCHGLGGVSSRRTIPVLRGAVGAFLCTGEGRRYIVRLPNVAFAGMDDRALAATMNFIVFGLGGDSVPAGARPYDAREVGALRRAPLKNQPLAQMRRTILADAGRCAARTGG
jgi:hypothetical protein